MKQKFSIFKVVKSFLSLSGSKNDFWILTPFIGIIFVNYAKDFLIGNGKNFQDKPLTFFILLILLFSTSMILEILKNNQMRKMAMRKAGVMGQKYI